MRHVPATLAARLNSGATTLCQVWRLTRRDGAVQGFTDHDRDLVIDGVTFAARCGFEAAEIEQGLGLAATSSDVAGALSGEALAEADLANGLYDGARVERWLVDWSDPSQRLLRDAHDLGEVRRTQNAFTVELRAPTHVLDQEVGRLYSGVCAAEFADARCGLAATAWRAATSVLAGSTASRLRLAPTGLSADALASGVVTLSGGASRRLRSCALIAGALEAALWTPLAAAPQVGTGATLTAGCDKRFETCRDRFANAVNFRGFPHIPGADYVLRYASPGDAGAEGGLARCAGPMSSPPPLAGWARPIAIRRRCAAWAAIVSASCAACGARASAPSRNPRRLIPPTGRTPRAARSLCSTPPVAASWRRTSTTSRPAIFSSSAGRRACRRRISESRSRAWR